MGKVKEDEENCALRRQGKLHLVLGDCILWNNYILEAPKNTRKGALVL